LAGEDTVLLNRFAAERNEGVDEEIITRMRAKIRLAGLSEPCTGQRHLRNVG
jgi:hypothetical protein